MSDALSRRWSTISATAGDPIDVRAHASSICPYLLFLDSATGAAPAVRRPPARPLLLLLPPTRRCVIRSKGRVTEARRPGSRCDPAGCRPARSPRASCLGPFTTAPVSGLPPFQGGAAGYIGYDYGAVLERLPAARFDDLAPSRRRARHLRLGDRLGPPAGHGLDHLHRIAGDRRATGSAAPANGWRWSGSGCAAPARPRSRQESARPGRRAAEARRRTRSWGSTARRRSALRSTFTHRGYLDAVARVRDYIVAGDIFQANLSQRFQAPLPQPPFDLYRRSATAIRRPSPPISTSARCRC